MRQVELSLCGGSVHYTDIWKGGRREGYQRTFHVLGNAGIFYRDVVILCPRRSVNKSSNTPPRVWVWVRCSPQGHIKLRRCIKTYCEAEPLLLCPKWPSILYIALLLARALVKGMHYLGNRVPFGV